MIASMMTMFVYRLHTSIETKILSGGTFPKSNISKIKCDVSLRYDLIFGINGFRKKSTNCEILSVGHSLADTIGLPGGAFGFLCILGSR